MDDRVAEAVVSETPTDVQHPKMYEGATYLCGALAVLCVLALFALAALQKPSDAVITGLVAIGSAAAGGLVNLLSPKG